jgi:predicted RNA-binding protein YlqC (UPF0109 family)
MQAWLEFVAKGLADHPGQITVTAVEQGGATHYELGAASADVGKLVGRQGATIKAIRLLLQVGGAKQGRRCSVDVIEAGPADGSRADGPPRDSGRHED